MKNLPHSLKRCLAAAGLTLICVGCSGPQESTTEAATNDAREIATPEGEFTDQPVEGPAFPSPADHSAVQQEQDSANNKTLAANQSADAAATATKKTDTSADLAGEQSLADENVAYTPPFPERVELFGAPHRKAGNRGESAGGEDDIQLIGFATRDKPQALILFNGEVNTLSEGDTLYGVKVVSIQNPKVVLMRNRQPWQLSLGN